MSFALLSCPACWSADISLRRMRRKGAVPRASARCQRCGRIRRPDNDEQKSNMTYTVLYTDSRAADLDIERAVSGADAELVNPRQKTFDAIDLREWGRADAVVTARMPIDAKAIPHLKRTRIVVRHGVGFDIVDLEACGAAGIAVCNVPDYGTTEVADSAIAMMLAFARGTVALDA